MGKNNFFSGAVTSVLYENDDFRILRIYVDGDSRKLPVAVKGNFPAQNVQIGSWIAFEGRWKDNKQYGKQLEVVRSPVPVNDWTDERVDNALMANGVGPSVRFGLRRTAKQEGSTLFDLMESGDLSGVKGLDAFSQTHTITRWKSLRVHLDAASFMADVGLSSSVVSKIWKTFGTELEDVVTKDPWVLVRVAGVTFKEADSIAIRLGVPLTNPGRIRGAVLAAVQETIREGHVFATTNQVVHWVHKTMPGKTKVASKDIAEAIKFLIDKKSLMLDRGTKPGVSALYDSWHMGLEEECAQELAARMKRGVDVKYLRKHYAKVGDRVRDAEARGEDLEALAVHALENWAAGKKVHLTAEQMEAARNALTSPVSLLTGLPGTGKTTTLEALVAVIRDAQIPLLLIAPTGIAAKRMTSVTGAEALTVHRAFGAKGFLKDGEEREATYAGIVGGSVKKTSDNQGEEWGYGIGNPHPAKFVVVDEGSMLDLHMLYRILTSTSEDCRILFTGDPYQLPSVGSGDVLRDLVRSHVFAHSHLDKIFRQKGTSGIVVAAHDVHAGRPPQSDGKDFILISASEEDDASDAVVDIAMKLYAKRINFQVLSPRHGGDAGVTTLNQRLRMALNPPVSGVAELRVGSSVIREGDRIMVVKNDYERGVYNGDVGKVSRIDKRAKQISLKIFEGPGKPPRMVRYTFKDAAKSLRLAYAQTVHKSQGQEYDVIVIPVLPSFGRQLQRNLFYTAITRAKKKVFLVGTASAVARSVRSNQAEARNTLLAERIHDALVGG